MLIATKPIKRKTIQKENLSLNSKFDIMIVKSNNLVKDLIDRVSAKTGKDCSEQVSLFLKGVTCKNYTLTTVISEHFINGQTYKEILKNNSHVHSLKLYAIRKWLNYANKNSFDYFITKISSIILKLQADPHATKLYIDEEISSLTHFL